MTAVERFHHLFDPSRSEYHPLVIPMICADHSARVADLPINRVLTDEGALVEAYNRMVDIYRPEGILLFMDVSLEAEAMGATLFYPRNSTPYPIQSLPFQQVSVSDPLRGGRVPLYLNALRRLVEQWGTELPILASLKDPFSLAAQATGAAKLLEATILEPEAVDDLLMRTLSNQRVFLEQILTVGAIPFFGAPIASGSLISHDTFRRFVSPSLNRLADIAHSTGRIVGLHICGRIEPLLPAIKETAVDILSIETAPDDIVEQLPAKLLMGLGRTDILLSGTPDQNRSEARRSYDLLAPRCILSSGCDVPQEAPCANVLTFMDESRRLIADA